MSSSQRPQPARLYTIISKRTPGGFARPELHTFFSQFGELYGDGIRFPESRADPRFFIDYKQYGSARNCLKELHNRIHPDIPLFKFDLSWSPATQRDVEKAIERARAVREAKKAQEEKEAREIEELFGGGGSEEEKGSSPSPPAPTAPSLRGTPTGSAATPRQRRPTPRDTSRPLMLGTGPSSAGTVVGSTSGLSLAEMLGGRTPGAVQGLTAAGSTDAAAGGNIASDSTVVVPAAMAGAEKIVSVSELLASAARLLDRAVPLGRAFLGDWIRLPAAGSHCQHLPGEVFQTFDVFLAKHTQAGQPESAVLDAVRGNVSIPQLSMPLLPNHFG